jgi:two-component system response regulator AtoC
MKTVLIVNNQTDGEWENIQTLGADCRTVQTRQDALRAITNEDVRGVVVRVTPIEECLATIEDLHRQRPRVPIIVVSRESNASTIVSTIKSGASDYLVEPVALGMVRMALEEALGEHYKKVLQSNVVFSPTKGSWSEKAEVLIETVADTDVPVLLLGETGVGKEVLARRLHERSSRAGKPFLKLNCAALPSELVESELFGYERGAFTGAFRRTPGKFEMADGGTILLDEIGEMDFKLQAKLLQVLQDHEFLRLGSAEPTKIDVRVMAATHRNLEEAITAGTFREDLYFRLNIVEIHIPPLRQRRDEILELAERFLVMHSTSAEPPAPLPPILKKAFLEYSWPGNIRELENIIRRYQVLKDPVTIAEQLSFHSRSSRKTAGRAHTFDGSVATKITNLQSVNSAHKAAEAETILAALTTTRWNRRKAAALLSIDYKALLYKMNRLGIAEDDPPTGNTL